MAIKTYVIMTITRFPTGEFMYTVLTAATNINTLHKPLNPGLCGEELLW